MNSKSNINHRNVLGQNNLKIITSIIDKHIQSALQRQKQFEMDLRYYKINRYADFFFREKERLDPFHSLFFVEINRKNVVVREVFKDPVAVQRFKDYIYNGKYLSLSEVDHALEKADQVVFARRKKATLKMIEEILNSKKQDTDSGLSEPKIENREARLLNDTEELTEEELKVILEETIVVKERVNCSDTEIVLADGLGLKILRCYIKHYNMLYRVGGTGEQILIRSLSGNVATVVRGYTEIPANTKLYRMCTVGFYRNKLIEKEYYTKLNRF